MAEAPDFRLRVQGLEGLQGLRDALRAWLADAGVGREVREEIVLASWEAATNALEHPSAGDGIAEVRAERTDGHVLLSVADHGSWRVERAERRGERGMGLRLIEALMDHVRIVRTSRGTRILMCRCLSSGLH